MATAERRARASAWGRGGAGAAAVGALDALPGALDETAEKLLPLLLMLLLLAGEVGEVENKSGWSRGRCVDGVAALAPVAANWLAVVVGAGAGADAKGAVLALKTAPRMSSLDANAAAGWE